MTLRGEGFVRAPVELVWEYLHDPEVLREVTPFVKRLEQLEGQAYSSESEVKVGPIHGTFRGKLRIEEMRIRLKEEDGGTRIEYEGDARMSGLLARLGQRLIGSTVKKVAGEFFTNLQKRLQADLA